MHTALNTVEIFIQAQEDDTKFFTTSEQLWFFVGIMILEHHNYMIV